uniref:CvpA family protein n=1 Tax=Schlesneria paludicola TaxID=360056 RepID=A0A7C4LLH2_9PLAN
MIDLILAAILVGVTYVAASDGAWSAGVTFLCTLLAGLLAMNFFEPLAILLTGAMPEWNYRWDMISLLGLFIALVMAFRMASERLVPTYVPVPALVDQIGRWAFAFGTGYVTMAFLLTALHTAPLPREFLGFRPERANLFNLAAPDRQWLGFTQYVTEHAFARYDRNIGLRGTRPLPHAFDATYYPVGDPANPYPNDIWPSFPIRYAMRRDILSGAVAAPAATPATPRVVPAPAGPGGGGGNVGF